LLCKKNVLLLSKLTACERKDKYSRKIGDFLLSLIQLIVGGIIFSSIMADKSINSILLYIYALLSVIILLILAIVMFRLSNKNKERV